MDYCRMIYEIFKTDQGVWAEMIGRLLDRCADKVPVVRLICYAAPADNREYLQWKRELQKKATIRCIPFDSFVEGDKEPGKCMVTGKPSACRVIFARSY